MNLVYDVAHNIAKMEKASSMGRKKRSVSIERGHKGISARTSDVPERYRHIGQPVIIPGIWANPVGCWSVNRLAWKRRSVPPVMGLAG